MKKDPQALCVAFFLLLFIAAPHPASAQSDTGGSIAGQISGISGNHFRALIALRNTATGVEIETLSDARGNFRFAEVTPGNYAVRINAPGAAPWRAVNVTVEVGRITLLAPRLTVAIFANRPGKKEFHAPQADLTPAVSSNVDQEFVESLPGSSSHWSAFAALAPGAAPDADGSSALSFRGLSPLMNGITLDGVDNTLAFYARERGTSGNGYATPRGAVSQFQVSASNFSSAYGRAAGGVINSITKSGGNTLHIEASIYDRNSAWGAMNAYSNVEQIEPTGATVTSTGAPVQYVNGQPVTYVEALYKAPDQRLQGSFNAGGPIRRDKLFWFFAAEYHYRNFPGVAVANKPQTFFLLPQSTSPDISTLASRISTSVNPIVTTCKGLFPSLSGGVIPAAALCAYTAVLNNLNGILGTVPRTARQMNFFPKLDWRVNNRIHLIGQYNFMRRNSPNGVLIGATEPYGSGSFGNLTSSENAAVARLDYFFTPSLLTSIRFQYSRDLLSQLAGTPTPFEQQFANNTLGRAPQISIDRSAGFTFGTRASLAKSQYPLEIRQQFVDSVTWIHNRHAFRFGYDYNHVDDAVNGLNDQNGAYSYSSLTDFISDMLAPDSCDPTTTNAGSDPCYSYYQQTVGSPVWQFSTADYAAFAADDWKLTPRLTLSYGLRYEYERLPDTNKLVVNPDISQTATLPHDRNNFGPRAGFAWDVFGRGHTVLRGGYGFYYGRIPNATVFSALTSTGSARAVRTYFFRPLDAGTPSFPYVFPSTETPYVGPTNIGNDQSFSAANVVYFNKHFQNPQIDQAELSLQQELGQRTALTLTYMASFGRELPQFIDTNIDTDPGAVATLNYAVNLNTTHTDPQDLGPLKTNFTVPFYYQRRNPNYGPITDILSEANSKYQGAVVRLTRRTQRNIDLNVAYTYSHAVDDNQSEATFANLNDVYDPADLKLEHGTSNFDIRQRVSGAVVAHVPWRFNGFTGKLFNGYTLSTLGEWRTGLPYTMRTMGAIPVSECSYQEWLQAGGPNGGNSCASTYDPGVIINAGTGVPISGLGPGLNGSGGEDLIPSVGRNTFRYPGAVGLDVRAGKRTSITDRLAVEFFAEAFNVLNHQNVTNIQTVGYRISNDSADTNTANLTYLSGLETYSSITVNGVPQNQLISGPTAAFGGVTATNNNALYHARQLQAGIKLFF